MKKKKSELSKLLYEWSKNVKNRDNNVCCVCGSDRYVQAHHILNKKMFPQFRLDLDNGISLCAKHHTMGRFSAHNNAIWFSWWLSKYRNEQHTTALKRVFEYDKSVRF